MAFTYVAPSVIRKFYHAKNQMELFILPIILILIFPKPFVGKCQSNPKALIYGKIISIIYLPQIFYIWNARCPTFGKSEIRIFNF